MQVRSLLETDSIEALTSLLHRAYAPLGAKGLNYTAVNQTTDTTLRRIAGNECMVVDDGIRIIGTILFYPPGSLSGCASFERPGVSAIGQLAVDPVHQGKGIAKLMIRAAERRAIDIGSCELALDTAESASDLIAWYEREGFRFVEHVQWSDKIYRSVVMAKHLR